MQLLIDYDEYLEGIYIRYKQLPAEQEVLKQRHVSPSKNQDEEEPQLKIQDKKQNNTEEFSVVSVKNGGSTSYLLQDLRPNTKYDIFLVPYYKMLQGKPSNARSGKTLEDGV